MNAKGLLGVLIATILLFVWGFIFWGVLPTASMIFRGFDEEAAVAEALRKGAPEAGVYTLPDAAIMARDAQEYTTRHEAGPVAMIFLHPGGLPVMPASMLLSGFLNMLVSVFLMYLLLRMAAPALPSLASGVSFVVLAGVVSVVLIDLGGPVWWRHPWAWWVANAIYHTVGWVLVGLVLAWFRPARP